ncbi:hypothetical protein BDV19DRAFT_373131 [Aspergillus venezuelensis]
MPGESSAVSVGLSVVPLDSRSKCLVAPLVSDLCSLCSITTGLDCRQICLCVHCAVLTALLHRHYYSLSLDMYRRHTEYRRGPLSRRPTARFYRRTTSTPTNQPPQDCLKSLSNKDAWSSTPAFTSNPQTTPITLGIIPLSTGFVTVRPSGNRDALRIPRKGLTEVSHRAG